MMYLPLWLITMYVEKRATASRKRLKIWQTPAVSYFSGQQCHCSTKLIPSSEENLKIIYTVLFGNHLKLSGIQLQS